MAVPAILVYTRLPKRNNRLTCATRTHTRTKDPGSAARTAQRETHTRSRRDNRFFAEPRERHVPRAQLRCWFPIPCLTPRIGNDVIFSDRFYSGAELFPVVRLR